MADVASLYGRPQQRGFALMGVESVRQDSLRAVGLRYEAVVNQGREALYFPLPDLFAAGSGAIKRSMAVKSWTASANKIC